MSTNLLAPGDLGRIREIAAIAVHPTDGRILYVESGFDGDTRTSHLMELMPDDTVERRLPQHSVVSPVWSPDGAWLYFLTAEDEHQHVMGWDGRHPPVSLARFAGAVRRLALSPDGTRLALEHLPAPDGSTKPRVLTHERFEANGLGFLGDRTWQVHIVDVADGATHQVGSADWHHFAPAWSPDGRSLALVTTRRPDWDLEWVWDVYTVALADDRWEKLTNSDGVAALPTWSRDGRRLVFYHNHSAITGSTQDYHLMAVDVDRPGAVRCWTHALDRGAQVSEPPGAGGARPTELGDGRFVWQSNWGGVTKLVATAPDGASTVLLEGVSSLALAANRRNGAGLVLFPDRPAELGRVDLAVRRATPATDLNPWLRSVVRPASPRLVTLLSPDGPVEGWVWERAGLEGPAPLLMSMHGGPHGAAGPYFHFTTALLVSHGYRVAAVNFRGSGGYGQAFADLILGDWGTREGEDTIRLIDELVGEGVARPDRVGVFGGSYGGFMTNWLITRYPDRFAAAVTMSTISNLVSLAYGDDHWESLAGDMGGWPYEIPDYYREHSPLTRVADITAPLLILHGDEDRTCPPMEAAMLFSALRTQQKPVTWVRYPGESHGFSSQGRLETRVDAHERILGWFGAHLPV
ncbi:MAG: S9 family peptidase [Thermaerobacter sp.]|nr:S9 family peptidase [Thermaerobacter sp.]